MPAMTETTIDTLPEFSGGLDAKLRGYSIKPEDVFIVARANGRTVKTHMGGRLFVPMAPKKGDTSEFNGDFAGAVLKLSAEGLPNWRRPVVVWKKTNGVSEGSKRTLEFADGEHLGSFSEICIVTASGNNKYVHPWMPISFLLGNLKDKEGTEFPVTGTRNAGNISVEESDKDSDGHYKSIRTSSNLVAVVVK